ncbi:dihydrofolate reductase family protein [Zafaria sp. Z1313]|uniref:dihydrofolate reductase family protein n=1 Tax=unclassified Zafaria TaxID=2828765 RepID=UPI002E762A60|nr:dihydrofolate reductase family protein [Zafaria sp. J156]MEE1620168.1 dihydrofolate reductase family protein [Zafaria sp. J156]
MTRIRYYVAASADGYIADERNSLDWLLRFDDTAGLEGATEEFMAEVGSIVMGGETYAWLLANAPGEWPYTGIPTWVFTHRELPATPGADLTFIRGDVHEWVGDIREDAGEKDVWMMGGGSIAGQFADAALLDEVILFTMPVALGGGRPLLAMRGQLKLAPTLVKEYDDGVRETRYDVAGPLLGG